jgi:hypothetical protein
MNIIFRDLDWLRKQDQKIVCSQIEELNQKLNFKKNLLEILGMDYDYYKKNVDIFAPEWVVASIRSPNTIILLSKLEAHNIEYIQAIVKHEFVHIALMDIEESCPKYIFEGIAMHFAGQEECDINLNEITTISIDYSDENFYGKAYHLVSQAVKAYGYDELLYLVRNKKFDEINKTVIHSINVNREEADAKIYYKRS